MEIVLIGLNHKTAPVELRERVSFNADQAQRAAEQLRSRGVLSETLVLSTCNRSELYGVPPETALDSAQAMELFLATFHHVDPSVLSTSLYRRRDQEAVRHLFRVASGLDSLLLGEAEILGQVREAYRIALDLGATGPVLNRMFQNALEVGKRVRTETEIGKKPVSVAFAGVKLAERIFGSLKGHKALILGAGATGEQVIGHLRDRGVSDLRVANRSPERARELAARTGAGVVAWESLHASLAWPDMIVSSVTSTEPVLKRALLEQAMAERSNRSLLLVDLGMPRNIEPSAADLYNIYLYDMDHLSEIVEQNKKARADEVPRAEAIIEEQVQKFQKWQSGVQAAAVIGALRARLASEREAFLRERLAAWPNLSPEDRNRMAGLMDDLLNRVLLEPAENLKGERDLRRKLQNLEALRDLFRLDRDDSAQADRS
jgi:glutamyl-tRNA reductase